MTTNGESVSRHTTVISIVRQGDNAHVGSVRSSAVDPAAIAGLVAARRTPRARRPRPGTPRPPLPGRTCPTTGTPRFRAPARRCSSTWRAAWRRAGFAVPDQLYGFARHEVETTFLATSNGLRRRYTQPTGSVEINGKRDDASAWVGVSTPDFADVPTDSMLDGCRRG